MSIIRTILQQLAPVLVSPTRPLTYSSPRQCCAVYRHFLPHLQLLLVLCWYSINVLPHVSRGIRLMDLTASPQLTW